jgi:hypothetical protein
VAELSLKQGIYDSRVARKDEFSHDSRLPFVFSLPLLLQHWNVHLR